MELKNEGTGRFPEQENKNLKDSKSKKTKLKIGIAAGCAVGAYLVSSVFFINRFLPGTTINNVDVAGKTVEEAYEILKHDTEMYELEVTGRNGAADYVKGEDINIIFNENGQIQAVKEQQNPLAWITGIFKEKEYETGEILEFDADKLKETVSKFSQFSETNIQMPKNPEFKFNDGEFEIVPEEQGNQPDMEKVQNVTAKAVSAGKKEINLDEEDCYKSAKFNSESPEVKEALDVINKYASAEITYKIGDDYTEVINGNVIPEFIQIDENTFEAKLDKELIRKYVLNLQDKYNTLKKERKFKTSKGAEITLTPGDYGSYVDFTGQTDYLTEAIKNNKVETVTLKQTSKPYYLNGDDDIGNTYVEIDLGSQHLWVYKNGQLVIESDLVSGNVRAGHTTPPGIFRLKYKERDTVLRGDNYASPVKYWMPFNGGIGMHDADWRSKFGGSIYLTGGSHGCINLPPSVAAVVYQNVEANMPIICYY